MIVLLAALVLTAAAWLRGAEYDEQYTLLLTAGTPRPAWPDTVFPAGTITAAQSGHATMAQIARDLRTTDVHPPLYFWAVSLWRQIFGPGLFAARMLSVLSGLSSLALVGIIARRCAIPAGQAMLLTLGCYGFVYTDAIARDFAPAQTLILSGVTLLLGRRPLLAGVCLGAACAGNYLAVFIAAATIAAAAAWPAALSALPFLALDAWFFAAQHAARDGQFPRFALGPSLLRLCEYQAAAVFGGLPLYVHGLQRIAMGAIVILSAVMLIVWIVRARPLRAPWTIRMLLAAAVATPIGLLVLGAVFDNTPIEIRYLSFGLPFIALLVAWALSPNPSRWRARRWPWRRSGAPPWSCLPPAPSPIVPLHHERRARFRFPPRAAMILLVQAAGVAGLLLSPRTMQPMRAAAAAAARLVGDGIVLLPWGNDGVGIVGAFGMEAPKSLPILLIRPTDPIPARIAPYHRVVLAVLARDPASTATIALLRTTLAPPNWRRVAIAPNVELYERTDNGE